MEEKESQPRKLGLLMMVSVILAGAIGTGVYDISYQIATVASPGAALIAWALSFCGMLMLILTLMHLLKVEKGVTGLFVYAEEGFGPLGGFLSGWGYWMSGWIGNIGYCAMMMTCLGAFFPVLGTDGTSWPAIVLASVILWVVFFLINRGVENTVVLNSIITAVKLVPLVVFAAIMLMAFDFGMFTTDFWTNFAGNVAVAGEGFDPASVGGQITDSLLSIIWVFMGVEGAALMSHRAKSQAVASRASILGLIGLTVVVMLISMVPYGVMTTDEIAALGEPSVAQIMGKYMGPAGALVIMGAIAFTIFGCLISWTLVPMESTLQLAERGLLPKRFAELNKNGVPTFSLLLCTILANILLVTTHFTEAAYNFCYSLSASSILVTWAFVTAYAVKRCIQNPDEPGRVKYLVIAVIGTLYFLYAMFISGLVYILLCCAVYVIGFYFYAKGRRESGCDQPFTGREKAVVAIICIAAVAGVAMYAMGMA